jgi:large subunit ribosomal protein L1
MTEPTRPTKPLSILEALKWLRENKPERKFSQSFDLAINLKNIDMKKPESKFAKEVVLPHGTGTPAEVCLISDNIKGFENTVGKADIDSMGNDKKAAKIFIKRYRWFLAEPQLMVLVGRVLGRYLGPTGRMPKLMPPAADPKVMAERLSMAVPIKLKDSPVVHACVGNEGMTDGQIAENISKVVEEVRKVLPGKAQIKNSYLKLSMGPAIKLDVK